MKKIFLFLAMIAVSMPVAGQGVDFRDLTPAEAIAQAKAENKYLFVDAYTNWCAPCKMMDAQVFPLKEMGDYFNPKFVSIKVNAEVGEEGIAFAKKYGIRAYPTFVILDGEGELVHIFVGGWRGQEFIDRVEESFDPAKAFGGLRRHYDAGERDPRFVATYLEALQNTSTATDIGELVDEFYGSISDEDKITPEALFMFDVRHAPVGSAKDDFFTANLDRFRKMVGSGKVDETLERKYLGWYIRNIQYQQKLTSDSIVDTGRRLASLGLEGNMPWNVLEAAAIAKTTGEGADIVYDMLIEAAPAMDDDDRNLVTYYIAFGLKDALDREQKDALLTLIGNESTKNSLARYLNR